MATDGWSDAELKASVAAYLSMLAQQSAGLNYSKAEFRRRLIAEALPNRTEAAVEYRMQNISAAMEELCLPIVSGYPPAKNVGTRIKDRIKFFIEQLGAVDARDYAPEFDVSELEKKTAKLMQRPLRGKPRGQERPQRLSVSSQTFQRDPLVRAWVLQSAQGRCENCDSPSPFSTVNGIPYLEVHHVKPLAESGSDRIENAVAVCPNCHRALHLADDRESRRCLLYQKIARLIREP